MGKSQRRCKRNLKPFFFFWGNETREERSLCQHLLSRKTCVLVLKTFETSYVLAQNYAFGRWLPLIQTRFGGFIFCVRFMRLMFPLCSLQLWSTTCFWTLAAYPILPWKSSDSPYGPHVTSDCSGCINWCCAFQYWDRICWISNVSFWDCWHYVNCVKRHGSLPHSRGLGLAWSAKARVCKHFNKSLQRRYRWRPSMGKLNSIN